MGDTKRRMSIKLTQEEFDTIHKKAEQANRNLTDYILSCCLGKQIVVIPDMADVLREQRAIGVNLNRLATLANMGRITSVNLSECLERLGRIDEKLRETLERKRWSK